MTGLRAIRKCIDFLISSVLISWMSGIPSNKPKKEDFINALIIGPLFIDTIIYHI
jgi:hypothetical protein